MLRIFLHMSVALFLCACASSQKYNPTPPSPLGKHGENYDENKANIYKKLDTLCMPNSKEKISKSSDWTQKVRPLAMRFFIDEVYGAVPPRPEKLEFKLVESSDNALGGIAIRRQYEIISSDKNGTHSFGLLVYIPKNRKSASPVFLNANYTGNHTTCAEPEIIIPNCWLKNASKMGTLNNKASAEGRGKAASRHPMKEIVLRGYAVATFCYCAVYPDKDVKLPNGKDVNVDMSKQSIYVIFADDKKPEFPRAISAWSWGNMRAMDCLESIPEIDASRVAVVGHSRLGKTALYTAALDARFAMSISNESCALGAAASRRNYGETVKFSVERFPLWFSPKLEKYGANVENMPFDQQHLIAAIAPRPVYIASASEDYWADPKGELFSLVEASKIYALFGAKNFPNMENFEIEKPFIGYLGYHLRKGKHDITNYDWRQFMNFADAHAWNE